MEIELARNARLIDDDRFQFGMLIDMPRNPQYEQSRVEITRSSASPF
jgi:hypothetical protein